MKVNPQYIRLKRDIVEYVKKYPGCKASAISSALSQEFKNKRLNSHKIARIITKDLKKEIGSEKPDSSTRTKLYYPLILEPKPTSKLQSTTHEEGLDYVVDCFIDKNNFPITLYEISDHLGNKISEDDLNIILNKAFFIEAQTNRKPTRYKLKDSFYQYYLENKK